MSDPDDWPVQDPGDEQTPDQDDEPVRRDSGDDRLRDRQR